MLHSIDNIELKLDSKMSAINNSLTTNLYSSISCINKCINLTFLVPEDEEVISRDFKQQLRMERK